MTQKVQTYVASPYGFAESTRYWYDRVLIPMLEQHVEVLCPWRVSVDHIVGLEGAEQAEAWLHLGLRHLQTIEVKARLIVACLDQEPPDIGTVGEVFFGSACDIPVIGYRGDIRVSGEDGLRYNLMLSAAIRRSAGVEVDNLQDLEFQVQCYAKRLGR